MRSASGASAATGGGSSRLVKQTDPLLRGSCVEISCDSACQTCRFLESPSQYTRMGRGRFVQKGAQSGSAREAFASLINPAGVV